MQRSLEQDLTTLGLTVDQLKQVLTDESKDWPGRTAAFHELVRAARKQQQKRWHPDVCKEPGAVERAAEINAAADGLLTVSFRPRPAPVVLMHVFVMNGSWTMSGTASTTNTSTWFWPTF